jgi:hypothetical protein
MCTVMNNCHCLVKQQEKVLKAFFMLQNYETLTEYTIKYILVQDPTRFNSLPSSEITSANGMTCRTYDAH